MNNIKDHENLDKKNVLLRLDLNVPLKNGIITDQTRIDNKILPIINFLLNNNSKIIVISHVGRPKGKVNKNLSLKPICENLEKKINRKIKIIDENIFNLKKRIYLKTLIDQIVFLENIRFYERRKKMIQIFQNIWLDLQICLLMMLFLVHIELMHLYAK